MANRVHTFKANINPYTGINAQTTSTPNGHNYVFVSNSLNVPGASYTNPTGEATFVNVRDAINQMYVSDPLLSGKVIPMGYGWQKWIVPNNCVATVTARGACGGASVAVGVPITYTGTNNTSTLKATTASGCLGGRGAKISGTVRLNKDDVLYILVGNRGFCNLPQTAGNWGMSGGGASVILRDNPAGAYSLFNGRKVEILFVAGGGGGGTSCRSGFHGGDALPTNGANMNAGTTYAAAAWGGNSLTNASISCYASQPNNDSKTILSGQPSYTVNAAGANLPSWGGGGSGWYSGGGGGGYSGGNGGTGASAAAANQGSGGTSYMNPSYVTETFRGHEYDQALSPWTIPGEVKIEIPGKDEAEWFLACDAEGNKYWNPAQNKWALIPNQGQLTPTDFETYGTVPSIDGFTGFIEGNVKFFCSSPYQNKDLTINGLARTQLIKCNFEISLVQVDVFKSWNLNNLHPSVTIKAAVSVDHGLTYKILISNIWTNIDINNKDLFYAQGIMLQDLNTIPNVKWKELGATNLRFAFIVHQNANHNNPVLSSIDLVADLLGSWRKAIHGTNYDYEYIAPDTCKITINTAGDYKINYLDVVDDG